MSPGRVERYATALVDQARDVMPSLVLPDLESDDPRTVLIEIKSLLQLFYDYYYYYVITLLYYVVVVVPI